MQKVYADPKLPYSQESKFAFPDNFRPCGDQVYVSSGPTEEPESVEGIFE